MESTEQTQADLQKAREELTRAETAHQEATKATKGPRDPALILGEFLTVVASRLGNHPDLESLVKEWQAGLTKAKPAQSDEATAQPAKE